MSVSSNLFQNFRFTTGYLEIRCSKLYYLYDFELTGLFGNKVIEQSYPDL